MGKINAGRVLLGGLLAGVVINISEWFWNGVVFMKDMQDAMAKLGKTMDMGRRHHFDLHRVGFPDRHPGGVALRGDPAPLRRGPQNRHSHWPDDVAPGLRFDDHQHGPYGPVPGAPHAARLADQSG